MTAKRVNGSTGDTKFYYLRGLRFTNDGVLVIRSSTYEPDVVIMTYQFTLEFLILVLPNSETNQRVFTFSEDGNGGVNWLFRRDPTKFVLSIEG